MFFFFFKQKTAYEMRISDWSSDVCSSDLVDKQDVARAVRRVGCGREQNGLIGIGVTARAGVRQEAFRLERPEQAIERYEPIFTSNDQQPPAPTHHAFGEDRDHALHRRGGEMVEIDLQMRRLKPSRSEEHTSELQ